MAWLNMKRRCNNPNTTFFSHYGARGIKVCDRWLEKFDNFFEDMGKRPAGCSLDRIDNNGNYEPANCRWATWIEQNNNQRERAVVNRNNLTGVKGVTFVKRTGKYRARVLVKGQYKYLGEFPTLEEAADAVRL
jgi:hypothetical protein